MTLKLCDCLKITTFALKLIWFMSQFIKDANGYDSEELTRIDFDSAVKLSSGGSTCDIYRTRWQRRDVFVKRLKEEYRHKPLYLDALDKEFDIGVGLHHPSLPEYREFHRDYIVMDYIDGQTLADMMSRKDPWLAKEKNIVRLLTELVNVVDYLHRHNVVHCDIKPDNIIITANNKNLVLVDFDKSYTDALNDTSGHPGKYGLSRDEVGRVAIDFHAIGMLAERLKSEVPGFKFPTYKKFVGACFRHDVNCEELKEILQAHHPKISVAQVAITLTAICLLMGIVVYMRERPAVSDNKIDIANHTTTINDRSNIIDPPTIADTSNIVVTAAKTRKDIHVEAQEMARVLDKRIQPEFDELLAGLDRLNVLKSDESISGQQLLDSIRHHGDLADEYITEAFEILKDTYPSLSDREAWRIMAYSKAYTGYTRRATPELKEVGQEIDRRFAQEGFQVNR